MFALIRPLSSAHGKTAANLAEVRAGFILASMSSRNFTSRGFALGKPKSGGCRQSAARLAPRFGSWSARIAVLVAATATVILANPKQAEADTEKGGLGIGLIIGEPTGLSAKYFLTDDTALDFAVGFGFIGRGLQVHGDYLWHPLVIENTEVFALRAYLGPGLRILRRDDGDNDSAHVRFGLRLVGGVLFDFRNVPFDVFVEAALVGDYRTIDDDHFGIDINVGAGVRYYF